MGYKLVDNVIEVGYIYSASTLSEKGIIMRAVVTVIGKDKKGIIAGVSTELANAGINIPDINQTILQEFFTMIMLVDMTDAGSNFRQLNKRLTAKGLELGVQIRVQREDIFNAMHQV
jgi:ACT domain-containing protein